MAKSRFYFHLLQITIAQMLKAHGFTKAASQHVLEVFTDIAIRYLDLLVRKIQKYMESRADSLPNIRDISQAFLELKVITPSTQLDIFDTDRQTGIGVENFENWFNSDVNNSMREVSRPNREFLEERKQEKKRLQKNTNSKMDDLTKALDEQAKQAQLANPTMPYLPPPSVSSSRQTPISTPFSYQGGIQPFSQIDHTRENTNNHIDDEVDYKIPPNAIDEDWIQYLIRDQILTYRISNGIDEKQKQSRSQKEHTQPMISEVAHLKPTLFKGTVFEEYIPKDLRALIQPKSKKQKENTDFLIAGPIPEKLMHTFPYYKSDDDSDDFSSDSDEVDSSEEDASDGEEDDNEDGDDGNGKTNHTNPGLAAYDYYEHHNLYDDDDGVDVDLYGTGNSNNDLSLFG